MPRGDDRLAGVPVRAAAACRPTDRRARGHPLTSSAPTGPARRSCSPSPIGSPPWCCRCTTKPIIWRASSRDYRDVLVRLPFGHQIVLVPNACRDATADICRRIAAEASEVERRRARAGWLGACRARRTRRGERRSALYTNSARTTPQMLSSRCSTRARIPASSSRPSGGSATTGAAGSAR